jgi:hypothetical protein
MERNTPHPAYKARNRRRIAEAHMRADVRRDMERIMERFDRRRIDLWVPPPIGPKAPEPEPTGWLATLKRIFWA